MKRSTKVLLAIGILGLAGVAFFIGKKALGPGAEERYATAPVERADIEQVVSASGTLNPVTVVNVGTQVSGIVRRLHVDFNDRVEEGQVLAELDQSLLQTQLAQSTANHASAQASLKLATADYARQKTLHAQEFVPKAELDRAEQALAAARSQVQTTAAQVARDRVNIGYSVIRSPVAGVVISREVDIGQTVAASFQTPTLFKIAEDMRKMKIDTNLSEADVGSVKPDLPVRFTVDAFPGREFAGKVLQVRLNPTNVQNVVTYNVVIDVDNPDLSLLPGMTAFVTIILAEHPGALRLPNAALTFRPEDQKPDYSQMRRQRGQRGGGERKAEEARQTVYVLRVGKPSPVKVKTGISDGRFTEIVEGELREGMQVVTDDLAPREKQSGGPAALLRGGAGGGRGMRF